MGKWGARAGVGICGRDAGRRPKTPQACLVCNVVHAEETWQAARLPPWAGGRPNRLGAVGDDLECDVLGGQAGEVGAQEDGVGLDGDAGDLAGVVGAAAAGEGVAMFGQEGGGLAHGLVLASGLGAVVAEGPLADLLVDGLLFGATGQDACGGEDPAVVLPAGDGAAGVDLAAALGHHGAVAVGAVAHQQVAGWQARGGEAQFGGHVLQGRGILRRDVDEVGRGAAADAVSAGHGVLVVPGQGGVELLQPLGEAAGVGVEVCLWFHARSFR